MPLYEYQCDQCGHRFEIIRKMSDPAVDKCPTCGGPVHKLQSAPAFQFKGSGWYVTDYARKEQSGSTKSEGESSEGESKDAKPAEKSGEKSTKTADGTKSETSSAASSSTSASTTSSAPAPSSERN